MSERVWTVGRAELYDEGLARSPGRFGKGGRDERGEGGTVFSTLTQAAAVAAHATATSGEAYGVYEVEIKLFTPIAWRGDGTGELLMDAPIVRRVSA